MRITLSGDLGSGKSTVGRILSEKLGVPYTSTGQIFRDLGKINNMDALRANLAAENNREIDDQVDAGIMEINRTQASFILDSRMAWHFTDNAAKVFLAVDPRTAAARIMKDSSRDTERYGTETEAIESLKIRRDSELKRYKSLYDVDIDDLANYDLVILTDGAEAEAIAEIIVKFSKGVVGQKFWIPKARLVPMSPAPEDPSVTNITQTFEDLEALDLYISRNFGFFFNAASTLIAFLNRDGGLIPYAPRDAPHEPDTFFEDALGRLSVPDLMAWQEIAATEFAIGALVQSSGSSDPLDRTILSSG